MTNDVTVLVSFVSTHPMEGDCPKVHLIGRSNSKKIYRIEFIDSETEVVISKFLATKNSLTTSGFQYFIKWRVDVYTNDDNVLIHSQTYNPSGKVVFIKFDGFALGDNISWIPYVEEFRKKHRCTVICSTFHNNLFKSIYPNILFVKPNTVIENVYSQHYIGASNGKKQYCPVNYEDVPLQRVASATLGLNHKEIRPNLEWNIQHKSPTIKGKYVCISEYASHKKKHWREPDGWQKVVDLLNKKGYKVAVISKEPTTLKNIINLTGDGSLLDRMVDLYHCEFYMGVSSGLAWVAWSVGKKVLMISDCTPVSCEFSENNYRVTKNNLQSINYEMQEHSSFEDVSEKINQIIKS
tara:strand:+ start:837 stop:1892 length:1056 start_codon:yes stop_codon:yes gene_type:complete